MKLRLIHLHCTAALARRHGPLAVLLAAGIGALLLLAALSAYERRTAALREADRALATAADRAALLLDRDRHVPDALVASAAAADAGASPADRADFAGLDLRRADGSPVFADAVATDASEFREAPVPGFGFRVRVRAAAANPMPVLARLAIALAGIAALIAAAVIVTRRLRAAARGAVVQAETERALRAELAALRAAAERDDRANRARSRFVAELVHELRTPLNSILGFTETIRQEMFGPVGNPRYREYADLIRDAGNHLLSLINDLLDSARIEAGRMELVPIRLSAAALARSALDLVEVTAQQRGIALTSAGERECPDLRVDARAFRQVLVNLLSNAIKFTPAGGRIEIAFAAIADGGARITVSDTGIGMSTVDAGGAFEPFGRGRQARDREGTGLGLSLARALVRLHGGEVTLTSQPAAGTTVTVTLPPAAVCAAKAAEEAPADPANTSAQAA